MERPKNKGNLEDVIARIDEIYRDQEATTIAPISLTRHSNDLLTRGYDLQQFVPILRETLDQSLKQLTLQIDCDLSLDELWKSHSVQIFWAEIQKMVREFNKKDEQTKRRCVEQTRENLQIFMSEHYESAFFRGVKEALKDERTEDDETMQVVGGTSLASLNPRQGAALGAALRAHREAQAPVEIVPARNEPEKPEKLQRNYSRTIAAVLALSAALAAGSCMCGGLGTGAALSCNHTTVPHNSAKSDP